MKITVKVGEALDHHPELARKYGDVVLAAARELSDEVSMRVIRAHDDLGRADPDCEYAWNLAAERLQLAESDFLRVHAQTEVVL
jgi:hypothetical protein